MKTVVAVLLGYRMIYAMHKVQVPPSRRDRSGRSKFAT